MKKLEERVFDELLNEFKKKSVMAKTFGITSAAITKWSKFGVPKGRIPYLKLAFPKFKAWKNLN